MPSKSDHATLKHIRRVQALLADVVSNIMRRARVHDESKLLEPEASAFEALTPKLAGCTYGSAEYKAFLAELGPALKHHYENNRHHPEHWPNGVRDMTLLDLLEMLIDWKAASERHNDGSIKRSLEVNRTRFGYGGELAAILDRTALELWPASREEWHCFACGAGGMQGNFCEMCGAGKHDFDAKAVR